MKKTPVKPADILIPKCSVDLQKWAVVACDQFTSEKEYWENVSEYVGSAPSTLNIIYPECYLEEDTENRILNINKTMHEYCENGLFNEYKDSFIYIERSYKSKKRPGLIVSVDLEEYEPFNSSSSLIRPTEGTIASRIPPRKKIRENAFLECPHIMILISDKENKIFGLLDNIPQSKKIYDTPLMFNGGSVCGYQVDGLLKDKVMKAFSELDPLLFAVGDGNHSLATAKACYEDAKKKTQRNDLKSRYCLVEIENIYNDAVEFSPIHRVMFNTDVSEFRQYLEQFDLEVSEVSKPVFSSKRQSFIVTNAGKYYLYEYTAEGITVKTVDYAVDKLVQNGHKVDYIHDEKVVVKLSENPENFGIILPEINKDNFFTDIIKYGTYPRKTFSIGHPEEKRYYLECRAIN